MVADHSGTHAAWNRPVRELPGTDGRGVPDRPTNPDCVHLPGPVLHSRSAGGVYQGLRPISARDSFKPHLPCRTSSPNLAACARNDSANDWAVVLSVVSPLPGKIGRA